MNKKLIGITLLIGLLFLSGNYIYTKYRYRQHAKCRIGDKTVWLEIADNFKEREIGLSGRDKLGRREGMLFLFEYPQRPVFHMKNTRFPLDIIWIDSSNRIVKIQKGVKPCLSEQEDPQMKCPTYAHIREVQAVIELNGGISDSYNIKIGDTVNISYPK